MMKNNQFMRLMMLAVSYTTACNAAEQGNNGGGYRDLDNIQITYVDGVPHADGRPMIDVPQTEASNQNAQGGVQLTSGYDPTYLSFCTSTLMEHLNERVANRDDVPRIIGYFLGSYGHEYIETKVNSIMSSTEELQKLIDGANRYLQRTPDTQIRLNMDSAASSALNLRERFAQAHPAPLPSANATDRSNHQDDDFEFFEEEEEEGAEEFDEGSESDGDMEFSKDQKNRDSVRISFSPSSQLHQYRTAASSELSLMRFPIDAQSTAAQSAPVALAHQRTDEEKKQFHKDFLDYLAMGHSDDVVTARIQSFINAGGNIAYTFSSCYERQSNMHNATPLSLCAKYNYPNAINLLINNGADKNEERPLTDGETVLFYAIACGNLEATQALIENGANINHETRNGRRKPFDYARSHNHAMIEYLMSKGAQFSDHFY